MSAKEQSKETAPQPKATIPADKLPSRAEVLKKSLKKMTDQYRGKELLTIAYGAVNQEKAHERICLAWPSETDREPEPVVPKTFVVVPLKKSGKAVRVSNCLDESDAKCAYYLHFRGAMDPRMNPVKVIPDTQAA